MRLLTLLSASLLFPGLASAQVRLGAAAGAGYHYGFDAPLVGAAGEVSWMPEGSGVRLGARLFADYILLEEASFPGEDVGGDVLGRQSSAFRWGTAAVVYLEGTAPVSIVPYLKGGFAWEEEWAHFPASDLGSTHPWAGAYTTSSSGMTAFTGMGLTWGVVYAEAAYGVAVREYARPNVGGHRIAAGIRASL